MSGFHQKDTGLKEITTKHITEGRYTKKRIQQNMFTSSNSSSPCTLINCMNYFVHDFILLLFKHKVNSLHSESADSV
jgi:hypothetical protein